MYKVGQINSLFEFSEHERGQMWGLYRYKLIILGVEMLNSLANFDSLQRSSVSVCCYVLVNITLYLEDQQLLQSLQGYTCCF